MRRACSLPVVLGLATTLHAQVTLHHFPSDADTNRPSAVASADVNDDGFADVLVGAIGSQGGGTNSGAVRVYSGRDRSILYTRYGAPSMLLGNSIAGIGDVDGDGYADFIAGASRDDSAGTDAGAAIVYSGADGTVIRTHYGATPGAEFGTSVAGLADINEDGVKDYVVGARVDDYPIGSNTLQGSATVFSGATGALLYIYRGQSKGDNFGFAVDDAGDVNQDGVNDLIVGARYDDQGLLNGEVGSIWIYSGEWLRTTLAGGMPASPMLLQMIWGVDKSDNYGTAVSGAGDVDMDGFADVMAGADGFETGVPTGYAEIWSGQTGALLRSYATGASWDSFGHTLDAGADVDGDGYPDAIVGAAGDDVVATNAGAAFVYAGYDGALLATMRGFAQADEYGSALHLGGDVNGDGLDDLMVVAEHGFSPNGAFGTVTVSTLADGVTNYGEGCGGPSLSWLGVPAVGSSSFAMTLYDAPTSAPLLIVVGRSDVSWGVISLPADLTPLGAPGCELLCAVDALLPSVASAGGTTEIPLPVPGDPTLAGQQFFLQVAVADAGANPLGYAMTDALDVTID